MYKLYFFVFAVLLFTGCQTPATCLTLCSKVGVWNAACATNPPLTEKECGLHYRSLGESDINKHDNECWKKLTTWVLETGSEKIDCAKPPPLILDPEKQNEAAR